MAENINCLLCGVGGQGTVLASKLIALAAMRRGESVRTSETIGMAQRGGCVVSHVRTGEDIASPLIPKHSANVMIAFEPAEAVRCLDYLAPGGAVIVNKRAVMPITVNFGGADYDVDGILSYLKENVAKLTIVDGDEICALCGSPKVLNIALLASAVRSGALSMTIDELRECVRLRVKERYLDMNLRAIDLGGLRPQTGIGSAEPSGGHRRS